MRQLLYRFFLAPLTVFFLLGAWAGLPAHAQDDTYTIKAVSVDATGTTALDARNKAFAEARRKAYGQLADRILSPERRPGLVMPDDKVLSGMVRDFEIVREKMTSKRYVGTLDIRFTPAAVKRTMQVADVAQTPASQDDTTAENTSVEPQKTGPEKTETQAPPTQAGRASSDPDMGDDYVYSPSHKGIVRSNDDSPARKSESSASHDTVLVLPWFGPVGRQTLWGPQNPWRDAWEADSSLARDKAMPVVLPVGDVDDLRDYAPPQPLSRRGNIDALMKRYEATRAVLALAEQGDNGGVVVSLYQYEAGAPVPMGRFGVDASDGVRNVMALAVRKTVASLRAMPGADETPAGVTPVSTAPETRESYAALSDQATPPQTPSMAQPSYHALARFSGLQQWVSLRQALAGVAGVGGMNVRAISPSQANIDFAYDGAPQDLRAALAKAGLTVEPAPDGMQGGFTLSLTRSE